MKDNKTEIIYEDIEFYKKEIKKEQTIEKLKQENNYDEKIVEFYNSGYFIINGKKHSLNKINIVGIIKDDIKDYMVDYVDSETPFPKNVQIMQINKLKNTSIFEILINKYKEKIKDNVLIFDEEMNNHLKSLKWDGKLHMLVPQTHEMVLRNKNDVPPTN